MRFDSNTPLEFVQPLWIFESNPTNDPPCPGGYCYKLVVLEKSAIWVKVFKFFTPMRTICPILHEISKMASEKSLSSSVIWHPSLAIQLVIQEVQSDPSHTSILILKGV